MATKPRSVRIPDDLWDALTEEAARRGMTVTALLIKAARQELGWPT
jgi:predicted DNA-binding ribbon-helix-helix protein